MTMRPWDRWPERWQIAEEYYYGESVRRLAMRYHRSRALISKWLKSLGLLRTPAETVCVQRNKMRTCELVLEPAERHVTPQLREFLMGLVLFSKHFDRSPTLGELSRLMETVRRSGVLVHHETPSSFEEVATNS